MATRAPKAGRSAATTPATGGAKAKAGARSGTNGAAGAKAATATTMALDKKSPAYRCAKAIVDRLAGIDYQVKKWANMDVADRIKLVRAAARHVPEASTAPS